MAKRKRNGRLQWRSKRANHGRKPCRGRDPREIRGGGRGR